MLSINSARTGSSPSESARTGHYSTNELERPKYAEVTDAEFKSVFLAHYAHEKQRRATMGSWFGRMVESFSNPRGYWTTHEPTLDNVYDYAMRFDSCSRVAYQAAVRELNLDYDFFTFTVEKSKKETSARAGKCASDECDLYKQLKHSVLQERILNFDIDAGTLDLKLFVKLALTSGFIADFNEIIEFANGCLKIQALIENSFPGRKLTIIAPGDSPSKIVKFLEWAFAGDPRIQFVNFPLSGIRNISTYEERDAAAEYIKSKLPVEFDELLLMDFIAEGCTFGFLLKVFIEKIENSEHPNKEIKLIQLNEIDKELDTVLQFRKKSEDYYRRTKGYLEPRRMNRIVSIEDYFEGGIPYLKDAEKRKTRLLPFYKPHQTRLNSFDALHSDPEHLNNPDLIGGSLFVSFGILYSQQPEKVTAKVKDFFKSILGFDDFYKKYGQKLLEFKLSDSRILKGILYSPGYSGPNTFALLSEQQKKVDFFSIVQDSVRVLRSYEPFVFNTQHFVYMEDTYDVVYLDECGNQKFMRNMTFCTAKEGFLYFIPRDESMLPFTENNLPSVEKRQVKLHPENILGFRLKKEISQKDKRIHNHFRSHLRRGVLISVSVKGKTYSGALSYASATYLELDRKDGKLFIPYCSIDDNESYC